MISCILEKQYKLNARQNLERSIKIIIHFLGIRVLSLNFSSLKYLFGSTLNIWSWNRSFLKGNVVKPGFKCGVLSLNLHEPKESSILVVLCIYGVETVHCMRVYVAQSVKLRVVGIN